MAERRPSFISVNTAPGFSVDDNSAARLDSLPAADTNSKPAVWQHSFDKHERL